MERIKSSIDFTIWCSLFNQFRFPFHSSSKYPWRNRESSVSKHCMTYALPGLFAVRQSPGWLFLPLRSAEGDQALWLKVGTNVRKWFRLLRFSFFSLCVVYFMEKKHHSALGAKAVGTGFDLKNKIPDLSAPVRQGFDFQSGPQQDQQTFEVSGRSRFPLFVSLWQRYWSLEVSTQQLAYQRFTKGVVDFKMLWAHSVLHSTAMKNTGWITVTLGAGVCH